MSNVINLFDKTRKDEDLPQLSQTGAEKTLIDDLKAAAAKDYRNGWKETVRHAARLGLPLEYLEQHSVTINDLGKGITISGVIHKDQKAAESLAQLVVELTAQKKFFIPLGQLPESLRGYVYSLKFADIVNASVYAETETSGMMGPQVRRRLYYR